MSCNKGGETLEHLRPAQRGGRCPICENIQGQNRALSNLIWLNMSLFTAGGLDQKISKGPVEPKLTYDNLYVDKISSPYLYPKVLLPL